MEEFVNFELSKKLHEKGFSVTFPFAMYGDDGYFYPLYTSERFFYNMCDFDIENNIVAPTINQVLLWLEKEKHIVLNVELFKYGYTWELFTNVRFYNGSFELGEFHDSIDNFYSRNEALLNGIEFIMDNLI